MATILVVDDELGIRGLLSEILSDEGHTVELAENAAQARAARERLAIDLVLLDIWMPDVDGISLLKEWSAAGQLSMPVIMMSGHGTIDTAVEATKFGAAAFLEKPITLQKLLRAVEQSLARPAGRPSGPPAVAIAGLRYEAAAAGALVEGMGLGYGPAGHGLGGPGLVGGPSGGGGVGGGVGYVGGMGGSPGVGIHGGLAGMANGGLAGPAGVALGHGAAAGLAGPAGLRAERSFDLDRPLREARDAFEKSYFEFHLAKENGSMTRVAEKTGLERTHLYRKLKQLGVDLSRNKRGLV